MSKRTAALRAAVIEAAERCPAPSMFVEEDGRPAHVESEFLCCVCNGVMLDPVQAPGCLHDVGLRCVVPHGMEDDDPTRVYQCPEKGCTTTFTAKELKPCIKIGRLIARLPVACPNSCGWHGAWGSSQNHVEKACHMEQLECPFGCGTAVQRKEMIDHKKVCDRRISQCQYCLTQHRFINLHLHEERCDLRPITCSGCDSVVRLGALPRHRLEECGATIVSCPFVEFGCPERELYRRDVAGHLQGQLEQHCSHLMVQIQKERAEYSEHVSRLEDRIAVLEGRCGIGADGKPDSATAKRQAALLSVETLLAQTATQQELLNKFMNGNVIVVDASGLGGARTSIQRAVDDASSGDVVLVRPGTYVEDLQLTKPRVWVRGADRDTVLLKGKIYINWVIPVDPDNAVTLGIHVAATHAPSDNEHRMLADAVAVVTPSTTLENLAISNMTIESTSKTHPAIRVNCAKSPLAKPRIQNSTITCVNMACVVVENGYPSFETCTIADSRQFGVHVRGGEDKVGGGSSGSCNVSVDGTFTQQPSASCRLLNCTIRNHREPNILVDKGGYVFVSGCEISHSDANGVLVKAGGLLEGRNTTFHSNRFSNIDLMRGSRSVLHSCHSHSSKKGGAFVAGDMVAISSTFFGNEMPNIVVMPAATLSLVNSKVTSSLQYGLVVKKDGVAKLRGCEVKGNCLENVIGEEGAHVDM